MRSIIDILHKNFQEDHINSRRFPGYVDTLVEEYTVVIRHHHRVQQTHDEHVQGMCWVGYG